MSMFHVTWKKNAAGEIIGWREWMGRLEKVREDVSQEVLGFFKVKPIFTPKQADPLTELAVGLLGALLRK